jgi:hypothetical protein
MTDIEIIDKYGNNMKTFIDSLKDTQVKIIYFNMNTQDKQIGDPHIITDVKTLNINGNKFYINSGVQGKWTYTYKPSALAYLFTRNDTTITGFLKRVEYSKAFEGGNEPIYDIGHIGNHLTVGLQQNKKTNHMITMTTHFTSYSEQGANQITFDVERTPNCLLSLTNPIPSDSLANKCYKDTPILLEVIEELRKAFLGQQGGYIEKGPRGGKYIFKNNVKRYIKHSIQNLVGGGPVLREEVIKMIYEVIVEPVIVLYRETEHHFVNATMLYDTNNHFNSKKRHIVVIYDIFDHDTCAVFYVDIHTIFEAAKEYVYRKQITKRKPSQKATRCYEELIALPMAYLQVLQNI